MDINVLKENNSFQTSVYRKKTFTGLGMKFDSFIPQIFKTNLLSCLVTRAFKICSTIEAFNIELNYLKSYFLKNSFPQYIIEKTFKKTLENLYNSKLNRLTVPCKPIYFNIPYLGSQSIILKRKLKKLVTKFYPQLNCQVYFKNNNTIQNYFPYKDKLPPSLVSNIIYKYTCRECSATYIGQTQKQLKVRVCQHKGISYRNPHTILSADNNSAILNHSLELSHEILAENFKILSSALPCDLHILESIFIHIQKPSLNNNTSSFNLNILK